MIFSRARVTATLSRRSPPDCPRTPKFLEGGRPTSYLEVAGILDQLLADEPTLMTRIDDDIAFKSLADAIRTKAGKGPNDKGWADSTLRDRVRKWHDSK
jgi:hypothetical protein